MTVRALGLCTLLVACACVDPDAIPDKSVRFAAPTRSLNFADYVQSDGALGAAGISPSAGRAAGATPGVPAVGGASAPSAGAPAAGRAAAAGAGGSAGRAAPPVLNGGMGSVTAPAAGAEPGAPAQGLLRVKLTSVDMRGRYSPRNCGAVWIETADGKFVKTMERWCGIRAYYLKRWTTASSGWGSSRRGAPAMPVPDQMDAVSAATLRMHVAHESTWKTQNVQGEIVADGDYKLVIEVSDGEADSIEIPFKKGREPLQLVPADATPVTGLTVDYQPNAAP